MIFISTITRPTTPSSWWVGDVTPEEVRKLAEEKYASVPSRELAPRINEPAPPRLAETRINFALPGNQIAAIAAHVRAPAM
jgi:predicted Zn-dependent peptidase